MFPGDKCGRCVRLTTLQHPVSLSYLGTLTSWNPLGYSRPVTGLPYLYIYVFLDSIIIYRLYTLTTCTQSPSHSATNNEVFKFIVKILKWSALAGRRGGVEDRKKKFYGSRTSCWRRCLYILTLSAVDCFSAETRSHFL